MAAPPYQERCYLSRHLYTQRIDPDDEYDDPIRNALQPDEYVLQFYKKRCYIIEYECSHGHRRHCIRTRYADMKCCRIPNDQLSNSSFECVSSLLRDQGLSFSEVEVRRIATFMDEHRDKVSPGTPVMAVAEVCTERRELVNRCVFSGSRDWRELVDMMGSNWIEVTVWRPYEEPEEIVEEEVTEQNGSTLDEIAEWLLGDDDDIAQVTTAADPKSFPCSRYDGSGDDRCSICLEGFSQGDEFFRTGCSHNFHPSCIATWMMKKSNCPLCQKHIRI